MPTRKSNDHPEQESDRAEYLKELWNLSNNRIRHALSQKCTAVMSVMKKSYLGKYFVVESQGENCGFVKYK